MIKVYKTFELSDSEWTQLIDGFNNSFGLQTDVQKMKAYYSATVLGYSYHALDFTEEGRLRGYNSLVPMEYVFQGTKIIVGVSGGTYVNKEYRKDVFIFKHLMNALFEYCRNEGMVMKVGVPNKNSFKYAVKVNKAKHIGDLKYYILPVRLFNLIPYKILKPLNIFSIFFVNLHLFFSMVLAWFWNPYAKTKKIEIECSDFFYDVRFRNKQVYKECRKDNLIAFYRIFIENGNNVAYIMDFKENGKKTLKALLYVVKEILRRESNITAILYIGTMNLMQPFLFKIPRKFVPKSLPLTVNIINEDKLLKEAAVNMDSWDFSLQNFDVR